MKVRTEVEVVLFILLIYT